MMIRGGLHFALSPCPHFSHNRKGGFVLLYPNSISLKVYGRDALFSDPITRVGGEKCSYPIPTYQAVKGILESCYWKPTFIWVPDEIRIMHSIETQSKGIRPISYNDGKNDLSIYSYLANVCYQVRAHFEWNPHRPDLECDRNENKHYSIAKRMLDRGGRRDIFLGTRECQGYIEPCEFGEGEGAYDNTPSISFGLMLHGITYPDENGLQKMQERYWQPVMDHGVIHFCRPEECPVVRDIHEQKPREFIVGENLRSVDSLYEEVMRE